MINVELSNIWSCVSLPNLLSSEQALFEAHLKLRRNQPGFDDFLGWLGCGDAMIARTIGAVERAADTICRQSQVLVVAGMGESWLGARAAVRLLGKPARDGRPAVLFVGDRMGSDDYLALFDRLEGKDFCLQLIMPEQPDSSRVQSRPHVRNSAHLFRFFLIASSSQLAGGRGRRAFSFSYSRLCCWVWRRLRLLPSE